MNRLDTSPKKQRDTLREKGSTESKPRGQLTLGDDLETKDVVNEANFMG